MSLARRRAWRVELIVAAPIAAPRAGADGLADSRLVADILRASETHLRALASVAIWAPQGSAIGAGFIRNTVWDCLAGGRSSRSGSDVDVVFYDPHSICGHRDRAVEAALSAAMPELAWEVRNQARMHIGRRKAAFRSLEDAIAHWPETATAVAARFSRDNEIEILAPHGLADLLSFVVRPVPGLESACLARWETKRWGDRWPVRLVGRA